MFLPQAWFEPVLIASIVVFVVDLVVSIRVAHPAQCSDAVASGW